MSDGSSIFSDPGREYCYLSRVQRFRRVGGGARFFVLTNDGQEAVFDVRFLSPHAVRARCYRPGEEPALESREFAKVSVEAAGSKVIDPERCAGDSGRAPSLPLRRVRLRRQQARGAADRRRRRRQARLDAPGVLARRRRALAFHESFELAPEERLLDITRRDAPVDRRGERVETESGAMIWSSRGYAIAV